MLQRGNGVRRLARLGNGDDQRVGHRYAGTVAVFGSDFNVDRNACHFLDPVARNHRRMVAGATGEDEDIVGSLENFFRLRAE